MGKRHKDYHVVMETNNDISVVSAVTEKELIQSIRDRLPDNFWVFYGVRFDTIKAVFDNAPMPSNKLSRAYSELMIAYKNKQDSLEGDEDLQDKKLPEERLRASDDKPENALDDFKTIMESHENPDKKDEHTDDEDDEDDGEDDSDVEFNSGFNNTEEGNDDDPDKE